MLRFALLGSGSRGNATVVEAGRTRLLIDCGFSMRETERRLAECQLEASQLDAILVTHEHQDHIAGVAALARRHQIPVWLSHGTLAAATARKLPLAYCHPFRPLQQIRIGDALIYSFPLAHDAKQPCQFVIQCGDCRLGMLSDTGQITPTIQAALEGCHGLLLECNHDARMLREGPYPSTLKRRVGGPYGHLENRQALELLERLDLSPLRSLVLTHISETNNQPEKAMATIAHALDTNWVQTASQHEVLGWCRL